MTIRQQIICLNIGLSVVTILLLASVIFSYNRKKDDLNASIESFTEFSLQYEKLSGLRHRFLSVETRNEDYFAGTDSTLLKSIYEIDNQIHNDINYFKSDDIVNTLQSNTNTREIKEAILNYKTTFDKILKVIEIRGFKDYGTEGEMREWAHQVENIGPIEQCDILMLRRHEKDYMLRNDLKYRNKFTTLSSSMIRNYKNSRTLTAPQKLEIVTAIDHYQQYFLQLVDLDQQIGIRTNSGLYKQLEEQKDIINVAITSYTRLLQDYQNKMIDTFKKTYFALAILILAAAILIGNYMIQKIVRPISSLSEQIAHISKSGIVKSSEVKINSLQKEINVLAKEFNKLLKNTHERNKERKKNMKILEIEKQKAQESDRLKTAFLANMSHEVRTPLNAVLGFSNMLVDNSIKDDDRDEITQLINANANELLMLFENIIFTSKLEAGSSKFEPISEPVSHITQWVNNFALKALVQHKKQDITIKVDLDDEIAKVIIVTDKHKLQHILSCITDNAIKFSYQGEVCISAERQNESIIFSITDQGIGIDEVNFNYIFERFTKVEERAIQNFRGAGVGLFTSSLIAELIGVKIWLTSTVGEGTTFFVKVPLKYSEPVSDDHHLKA